MQKSFELSNRSGLPLAFLGHAYAITGKRAEALAILKELEERYPKRLSTGMEIAMVHIRLGDKEQTFVWLEKAFQDRSGELPGIRWYPSFASVRDDLRYKDLLKRMGLPE